jgi:hypothetical protein
VLRCHLGCGFAAPENEPSRTRFSFGSFVSPLEQLLEPKISSTDASLLDDAEILPATKFAEKLAAKYKSLQSLYLRGSQGLALRMRKEA